MLFERLFGNPAIRPGDRGVVSGGPCDNTQIEAFTIGTTANAQVWVSGVFDSGGGTNNGAVNRGLQLDSYNGTNRIVYIDMETSGTCATFGYLTNYSYRTPGCSNGSDDRGIFAEYTTGNKIWYCTISTSSNATVFANTNQSTTSAALGNGKGNRAILALGTTMSKLNISSTGTATNFGTTAVDLSYAFAAGCSNDTKDRGIWGSTYYSSNMQTISTISTDCNATIFASDAALNDGSVGMEVCTLSNGEGDCAILSGGWTGVGSSTGSRLLRYINFISLTNSTYAGNLVGAGKKLFGGMSNGYA